MARRRGRRRRRSKRREPSSARRCRLVNTASWPCRATASGRRSSAMRAASSTRPGRPTDSRSSGRSGSSAAPLKPELLDGVNLVIVRELTSGIYFGRPSEERLTDEGREAIDTLIYTETEIRRIVQLAFRLAAGRRGQLTSVDKANVLASSR